MHAGITRVNVSVCSFPGIVQTSHGVTATTNGSFTLTCTLCKVTFGNADEVKAHVTVRSVWPHLKYNGNPEKSDIPDTSNSVATVSTLKYN